jgi:hypothetical protein
VVEPYLIQQGFLVRTARGRMVTTRPPPLGLKPKNAAAGPVRGGSRCRLSRFSWPTRIYWEDTDAGGVVYHARYVAFMERARTEWMRALGYGQERMRAEHGMVFAVRAMQMDFLGGGWTTPAGGAASRRSQHGLRAGDPARRDVLGMVAHRRISASFRPRAWRPSLPSATPPPPRTEREEQRMIATLLALQATVTEALPADVSNAAQTLHAQATTGGGINYLELMAKASLPVKIIVLCCWSARSSAG